MFLSRIVPKTKLLLTTARPSSCFSGCFGSPQFRSFQKDLFPATLQGLQRYNISAFVKNMASSGDQSFPPHKQERQPGKEHVMDPTPQFRIIDYKPSNKLKVALVTRGDSRIGRAVVHCFALEGATVAYQEAQDTLDMLRKDKTPDAKDPISIPADLGYDNNCKNVVDEVVNAFGHIDILINNCAEQYKSTFIKQTDEERLERVFRKNIFSYSLKHMKEGSSIINTTSVNAYKGHPTLIEYTSTKGAIVALTRALASQFAPRVIRVNDVAPGPIWTPLILASFDEEENANFGAFDHSKVREKSNYQNRVKDENFTYMG